MNNKKTPKESHYLNRELSTLAFNERVLALTEDSNIPLLERLRFLFICASNLDEFFEIRVAGLKEKTALGSNYPSIDGMTPEQTLAAISAKAHPLSNKLYAMYSDELFSALAKENIHLLQTIEPNTRIYEWCEHYFEQNILPILSPIGLDFSHPLPRLVNKSLNFIVSLSGEDAFSRTSGLGIVPAPRSLPRVFQLPCDVAPDGEHFVFLSVLISNFIDKLFPGMTINGSYQFRLTRNSDLFLDTEEMNDFADALQRELLERNFGHVVRLEIESGCPESITQFLMKEHNLADDDVYYCDGPVNLHRYMSIIDLSTRKDLKYPPFLASVPKALRKKNDIFSEIKKQDQLVHHPYQSYEAVINFIHQAKVDNKVLAIKQTLYRSEDNSRMVQALIEAAQAGKEVTAIIELRARFDEAANLDLASQLHKAGVLVLYGLVGYKVHAKMTLVIRQEDNKITRYAHLSTGNYHEHTAQRYSDFGFFTNELKLTEDIHTIFQQLCGMGSLVKLNRIYYSPFTLANKLIALINQQTAFALKGGQATIIIKVNGLTDKAVIDKLYQASEAGVEITLIIRSLCRLRPQLTGLSSNIRVVSILGRFLEHSRIYYFKQDDAEQLYLASADLMERNLYHRVELLVPIRDPNLLKTIKSEALEVNCQKNVKRWELDNQGNYTLKGQKYPQESILKKYSK